MISECRARIKNWIEQTCAPAGVYYDYVPLHADNSVLISFVITDIAETRTLDMSRTLLEISVKITVSSRNRSDVDEAIDRLTDMQFDPEDGIKNIFYDSFRDIEYEPDTDYFYSSLLNLHMNMDLDYEQ